MVVLDLDEDNNAEVVFTKELIQSKEDFDECDVVMMPFSLYLDN